MRRGHETGSLTTGSHRVHDHLRAHGVALDVAAAAQKIGFRVHQACLESPLPQRAAAAVDVVDVAHEAPGPGAASCANGHMAAASGGKQVHVIGHEHVGVDAAVILLHRLEQPVKVTAIVFLGKEGRLPGYCRVG